MSGACTESASEVWVYESKLRTDRPNADKVVVFVELRDPTHILSIGSAAWRLEKRWSETSFCCFRQVERPSTAAVPLVGNCVMSLQFLPSEYRESVMVGSPRMTA